MSGRSQRGIAAVGAIVGVVTLVALLGVASTARYHYWPRPTPVSTETAPMPTASETTYPPRADAGVPALGEGFGAIAAAVLVAGLLAAGIGARWWWRRHGRRPRPSSTRDRLAAVAHDGLRNLDDGTQAGDVVVACWHAVRSLAAERDVRVRESDAPREVARALAHTLPDAHEPLQELADLYRRAVYSRTGGDAHDRERARECLRRIAASVTQEPR